MELSIEKGEVKIQLHKKEKTITLKTSFNPIKHLPFVDDIDNYPQIVVCSTSAFDKNIICKICNTKKFNLELFVNYMYELIDSHFYAE